VRPQRVPDPSQWTNSKLRYLMNLMFERFEDANQRCPLYGAGSRITVLFEP
jgi:hypothetical protein